MPLTLEGTQALFRLGHHTEIVAQAGHSSERLRGASPELRVLIAHALFHSGDVPKAAALIARENVSGASPRIRCRCELISGLIKRRKGEISSAEAHFASALHFAREAKDPEQVAWATLHSFRTRAETQPHDSL